MQRYIIVPKALSVQVLLIAFLKKSVYIDMLVQGIQICKWACMVTQHGEVLLVYKVF